MRGHVEHKNFIFELGVEEFPPDFILPTIKKIEKETKKKLKKKRLTFESIKTYSTPRRFSIIINSLQTKQKDEIKERVGPAVRISFDDTGKLTKAGAGFLRSTGLSKDYLYTKKTKKGEYIAVKIENRGKLAKVILKEVLEDIILNLNFPKSMKWDNQDKLFARPIRWIVAILGKEIVDIELLGVKSGKVTFGNRYLGLDKENKIESAEKYESVLKQNKVIPDRKEREKTLLQQLQKTSSDNSFEIINDKKLTNEIVNITEYPTTVIGNFDEDYLKLPDKIITTTLREHQKCYAVSDKDGKLTSSFVFVSNGNPAFNQLIKEGNEKVIKPRLDDAKFYYETDTKIKLEDYCDKLNDVLYQKELGSIKDKTDRIIKLSDYIASSLKLDTQKIEKIKRAALLSKCDLVTLMLGEKEFTKLQGYIGKVYALESNENEAVANAIEEHYLPKGKNDKLPRTIEGAIVAIADKMDTVCGIIGVDIIPTGSNDPFALRRAANGIVRIIDNMQFEINIHKIIDKSFEFLKDKLKLPHHNKEKVNEFFQQRIYWLLQQKKIDYDVIESVMHIDFSNIVDLVRRAEDIQNMKDKKDFIKLVLGFKRVSNIIEKAKNFDDVDPELLKERHEKILFDKLIELKDELEKLLDEKQYSNLLKLIINFSSYIDDFFDNVLVNSKDTKLKNNRYNLLFAIRKIFLNVADFNKIVIENE